MATLGDIVEGFVPPPMPGPMTLTGRYVTLAPLGAADVPALDAANRVSDAIWDYLPYGPFSDEADYAAWVDSVAELADPLFFAVIDRATGRPGGVMSYLRITPASGSIEVGHICLSPRLQRTRAASEAIFLLADWAFKAGYRRFEWKCDALNLPPGPYPREHGPRGDGVSSQFGSHFSHFTQAKLSHDRG